MILALVAMILLVLAVPIVTATIFLSHYHMPNSQEHETRQFVFARTYR